MKELVNSMNTITIQHNQFRHSNMGWGIVTVELRDAECQISPKYDTKASLICEGENR